MSNAAQVKSGKTCSALIAKVAASGEALESLIQKAIKATLNHARLYHDTTLTERLLVTVQASIPGYAVNQLREYVKRHSPIDLKLSEDKKSIIGSSEKKDKDGNLVKAYSPDDVLEKAPFIMEKAVRDQNTRDIVPISYKMLKDRIAGLQSQLAKAIEPGARGILGPDGKIYHKNNPGYQPIFDSYAQYLKMLSNMAETVIPLGATPTESMKEKAILKDSKLIPAKAKAGRRPKASEEAVLPEAVNQ